jgi:hypothetical protein
MTKTIELSNGKTAIVDDIDFPTLNKYKWSFHGKYAHRVEIIGGKQKHIYMHRDIMAFPVGCDIDHINGNKLDNRKSNLRICTRSQNNANMGKPSNNTSGYKGVSWDKRANKWVARLNSNGKLQWSKHFDNKIDAAKAYNSVILEVFGQFAKLNNIKENI